MKNLNAVSLFSCIGVGEYYLKDIGINTVVANEIEPKRCQTYKFFHPDTEVICGDIIDKNVKNKILTASKILSVPIPSTLAVYSGESKLTCT